MLYAKDVIKGETTKGSTGTRVTLLIAIYHGVAQRIGPLTSVTSKSALPRSSTI